MTNKHNPLQAAWWPSATQDITIFSFTRRAGLHQPDFQQESLQVKLGAATRNDTGGEAVAPVLPWDSVLYQCLRVSDKTPDPSSDLWPLKDTIALFTRRNKSVRTGALAAVQLGNYFLHF